MKWMFVGNTDKKELAKTACCQECLKWIDSYYGKELIIEDEQDLNDCLDVLVNCIEGESFYVAQCLAEEEEWFISHVQIPRGVEKKPEHEIFKEVEKNYHEGFATYAKALIVVYLDEDARAYLYSMAKEWIKSELFVEWTEEDED